MAGTEPDVVRFESVDARSEPAQQAMAAYFGELDERFLSGFDPGDAAGADVESFDPPTGAFVVVRIGEATVGCGALQTLEPGLGEIKRMWVHPSQRGRGIASRLLADLERRCGEMGNRVVRLDTNAVLTEAIGMYERAGYRTIERYNDNPYAERWFEKHLD
ncbi:MAG: GNAT family N-acetyltransferase [Ilumatobacteraceae bacterium]